MLPLLPETSDSIEIGIKSSFLHNRLRFTADAFDTKYNNYQANFATTVLGTPVTNLINAGQISSKGIELELHALVTSRLTLSASAARINALVDSFYTPAGQSNVNGQPLPFSPKFKSDVALSYKLPVADRMKVILATDYAWQTEEQFGLTENADLVQPHYGIWNGSASLADPKSGWRVTLSVKNIMNKHYETMLTEAGTMDWAVLPRDYSRYVGISFHKDFF